MTAPRDPAHGLDAAPVFWAGLLAATLVAAGVRLVGLEQPSFWVDEFFTIARAGRDPLDWNRALGYLPSRASLWWQGAELSRIGLDNITQWRELGVTEWNARLGPALIGVVSIPLLGLAARPVVGGGAASLAVLLLAIHPWHIYWSQAARFYSSQFLFANLFLLGFAWGVTTGSRRALAGAVVAAVLAYLCHPTTLLMPAICLGCVALAGALRVPGLALARSAVALFLALYLCSRVALFSGEVGGAAGSFASQDWGPSLWVLLLGTAHRIDVVVAVLAGVAALAAFRTGQPRGMLFAAVAILYPLTFFVLSLWFPIAPRYYFASLFAWLLLASGWAIELDRRLGAARGRLLGLSAVFALCASLGFGSYLYTLDGAGARERWREALASVAGDGPVYMGSGKFQAQYYLGRQALPLPRSDAELASLPPGSWIIERSRGARPPLHADRFELEARYAIRGKPWSWVLYVWRVPQAVPSAADAGSKTLRPPQP